MKFSVGAKSISTSGLEL